MRLIAASSSSDARARGSGGGCIRSSSSGVAAGCGSGGAVVAFMDIRCASRAHDSVNVLDGSTLVTAYNESSTTPAPCLLYTSDAADE